MHVSQIMSAAVDSIAVDMKLSHAAALMREKNRRCLPVIDADNRLVGLFSRRELASAEPSAITTLSVGEVNYLTSKITVGQLMQKSPPTCGPDTLIEEAGHLIRQEKVACLPVVDQDGHVIGLVSETDILDFFLDITGCTLTDTARIAVKLPDEIGTLGTLLDTINEFGGYIATVISPVSIDAQGRRTVIVRHRSEDPAELDRHLREQGYDLMIEDLP
jgi:acetoin utilization protein AcuB